MPSPQKEKEEASHRYDTTGIKGLLLLTSVLMLLLSLFSFSYGHPSNNWIGLVGYTIGWILHVVFGIASYLIPLYLGWIGWGMAFHKSGQQLKLKTLYFSIFLFSLCILLSLIESQYPTFARYLVKTIYPHTPPHKTPYHLGGSPFFYLYRDLPMINLERIFNSLGVAIIFSATLLASVLFLSKKTLQDLFHWIFHLLKRPERAKEPIVDLPDDKDTDFMRYVKLRIPEANTTLPPDLLAIQPETELTSRPSLSSKEKKISKGEKAEKELIPQKKSEPIIENKETPAPAKTKRAASLAAQSVYNGNFSEYVLPSPSLLTSPKKMDSSSLKKDLKKQAEVLEETLLSFGIEAKVGQINCGPTITSFEVHPAIGVKVQKIKTLENDIALNMEAKSIRIIAPIPGKAAVGIEVPNPQPQEVSFKEMLQAYQQSPNKLRIPLLLGKAVNGDYVVSDLTKMPHCIIAGATGSGKSVCINTIVMSILYVARPDQIQLLMVDPKKVELTPYTNLPHMLSPVITEPQGAYAAMQWLVKEMENRYEIFKQIGVRNIESFNSRTINKELEASLKIEVPEKLPYLVGIVDELADLMMVSHTDIETPIARIAQMARAVGIHLILATQRPSREVITGLIKANFPARISFKVASRVNSQIVLDDTGAESLLGNGDMLFLPPGTSHLVRAQGAFIRDEDIHAVVKFISDQAPPKYRIPSFDQIQISSEGNNGEAPTAGKLSSETGDTLYEQALDIILSTGNASTTFLQRKLKIGYARAASLMDELQANGIVSAAEGSKPRRVLARTKDAELENEEQDE